MLGNKRKNVHPLGPAPLGRKLASALRPTLLSGVGSGPAPSSSPVFTQVREFLASS